MVSQQQKRGLIVMISITDQQYQEYTRLKDYYERQLRRESAESISLREDIDEPIRKCVMAFALLHCGPIWSCCGFDYVGQPIHKWHEYGRAFFILENNPCTTAVLDGFRSDTGWVTKNTDCKYIDFHVDFRRSVPQWDIPQWNDRHCPHYYEPAIKAIHELESHLMSLRDYFDSCPVVLEDSNARYKKIFSQWQYPGKEPWVICRLDLG